MKLYTAQIPKWRALKAAGIPLIDATVKSGKEPSGAPSVFAPSWELVQGYLRGEITPEQYTEAYTKAMRLSFQQHTTRWLEVLGQDTVAIGCYCKPGAFCHRLLLVDFFRKVAEANRIPFEYLGEFKA